MGAIETSLPADGRLGQHEPDPLADPRPAPRLTPRRRLLRKVLQVSVVRTVYLSARFRGQVIVFRGTRVRLSAGARILVDRGGRLALGGDDAGGGAGSLHIGEGGRFTVHGKVKINRGTRILVFPGAHLEIGDLTTINCNASLTCLGHLTIGTGAAISWNTNILDGNLHVLTVAGVPHPRAEPVRIGRGAWVGTGATVLGGVTLGDGAIVAAGSVVTADVPAHAVAAGNPARVIMQDAHWSV